jgi:5-hydroxyisourate hydrolase
MYTLKSLFVGALLSGLSSLALAAGNPLSVHVLNLEDGLPSPRA